MLPETIQSYFVILIIIGLFLMIYSNKLRASVSFMLAIVVFMITGILEPQEVLDGFANDKIVSIILLILITAGLRKNFNIEGLFDNLFGKTRNYKIFLFRMMAQVSILSSMINNTPVVALMTPYVVNWGKRNKISPSRLLIPLSFATIMGGMLTVIGTSTNLLLNGFLGNFNQALLRPLDLLFIGSCVAITGVLFILFVGYRFLPNHEDIIDQYMHNMREFIAETHLSNASPFANKTIQEAGLRNIKGLYLVEIIRDKEVISPVSPDEVLVPDDLLIFAGNTDDIVNIISTENGISLPPKIMHEPTEDVAECVISSNSSLIGKTVKASNFRNRYDAAVVAIHRGGERISGKIGRIKLKAGDMLLLFTGKSFLEKADLYRDLYLVSKQEQKRSSSRSKYLALGIIGLCIISLIVYGKISLFSSLLIIFTIMVGFGLITMQEIKRELDLNLVAILVFSLGLGTAIIKTNTGTLIGNFIIEALDSYGLIAIMVGLMFLANLLTSLIGNVGAVSISFPLALSISQSLGVDGAPFYLAIAYAASATFLTPISYQTNLIIYGPGGYTFKDFFKIGLPVTILYLSVATLIILLIYQEILLI